MSEVHRVVKNRNYTVISNYHLRDMNLSLKAKGLLSLIKPNSSLVHARSVQMSHGEI